jgi:hypothetical protein
MEDLKTIRRRNYFRVAYLGVCFTILLTAVASASNLVAQIYRQAGYNHLGQMCLFTVASFTGLTNIFTSHYKKKISTKTGLIGGAFAFLCFILAGALTTYCGKYTPGTFICEKPSIYFINIVSCMFMGIAGAFFWICQSLYVNACADHDTKGHFNGLFWSIMQSSQIISSVLATFVLGATDSLTFYIILSMFGLLAILMLSLLQAPVPYPVLDHEDVKPKEMVHNSLGQDIKTFFHVLCERKYYFLFIGMLISGICIAFYSNYLGTIVEKTFITHSHNALNEKIGVALIALAIGEVSAGYHIGRLADKHDSVGIFNITIMVSEIALLMTLEALIFENYHFTLACGLLWGFGDAAIQTMINVVIGSMFGGKVELFSAYRLIQSMGAMFGAAAAMTVPREMPIMFIIVIASAFLILHVLFLQFTTKGKGHTLLNEKRINIELNK